MAITTAERNALAIKIQQLDEFHRATGQPMAQTAELFDRHGVWEFIDEAYEGLHVQGIEATYEDIRAYLKAKGATA
jgi:hypothetical protein